MPVHRLPPGCRRLFTQSGALVRKIKISLKILYPITVFKVDSDLVHDKAPVAHGCIPQSLGPSPGDNSILKERLIRLPVRSISRWGQVSQVAVRTLLIVGHHPLVGDALRLLAVGECMLVEDLRPKRAVEERCWMDRGGDGIRPFPSGSIRRCIRTQVVRVRSLCSGLSGRPGSP